MLNMKAQMLLKMYWYKFTPSCRTKTPPFCDICIVLGRCQKLKTNISHININARHYSKHLHVLTHSSNLHLVQDQRLVNFGKGEIVNTSGFEGHTVSVSSTQLARVEQESKHRQYIQEWSLQCSNKTCVYKNSWQARVCQCLCQTNKC